MVPSIKRLVYIAAIACAATLLLGATTDAQRPTLDSLQSLINSGNYKAALSQASAYLDTHPGNRDARFLRAVALAGLGRNDKAIKAFKTLAKAWPNRPEPANNLAALYARRGEYKKARHWLRTALGTQKVYEIAHRNLGDVYTALATMAYSQVLDSGQQKNKGIKLALVKHMYYPRETGLLLPKQTGTSSTDTHQEHPEHQEHQEHQESSTSGEQQVAVKAPEPEPEPAHPPQKTRNEAENAQTTEDNQPKDNKQILQAVYAWAKAWSGQDYDAYIDAYTQDFPSAGNTSRQDWLAERKVRVTQKASIKVQVISPEVTRIDADKARVSFIQTYESPNYSDKVRKWLLMRRTDGRWLIARETSTMLSRG